MQANLLTDKGNLMEQFNSQHFGVGMKLSRKDLGSAVVRLATKVDPCNYVGSMQGFC